MVKSELIREVSRRVPDYPRRDVETVVNTIFGTISDALEAGDRVEVRGFGSFVVRERSPRIGRNPRTGEHLTVPAKRVPFFTPGKGLRERVDNGS